MCAAALCGIKAAPANVYAAAVDSSLSTPVEIYQGKYDDYTERDEARMTATSSHVFEIEDYKAMIYPLFTTVYTQDNPIVQIVPRELFTHRGEYFYVGAEYGFYVDTRANTEAGNISTVFVFDIESDLSLTDTDFAAITIKPLFCYDYYYLTSQNNFTFQQELYQDGEFIGYYTEDDMSYTIPATGVNDIVVAAQFCDSRVSSLIQYQENCNYFLKDIAVRANMFNEYHPNIGDDAYSAYADDGSFFTSAQTEFVATNAQLSDNLPLEFVGATLGLLLDIVPVVSDAWDVMTTGLSFVEYALALGDMGGSGTTVSNVVTDTDYILTESEMFNSKQSQIDNYGGLIKQAYAGIMSDETPVLFGTKANHYLQARFKVSHSGSVPWQTRFATGMALQMVKLGHNDVVREVATYEGINTTGRSLRDDAEYISLNVGENAFYQLPDGTANFVFTPLHDSHYFFTAGFDGEYDIEVTRDGADVETVYENGGYTVPMESGKTYYITVDTADKSEVINSTVYLDYKTFDGDFALYMDNGQEMYIKYLTGDKGAYHMTATDGVIFGRTYDESGNIADFDGEAAHKDFITSGQETRYMIIRNDGTSGVKQFSCQSASEWQPTVEVNQGTKMFSFTADEDGSYIFYCVEQPNWLSVSFYNSEGVIIGDTSVVETSAGTVLGYVVQATANTTIYITIKSINSQSQTLHFNIDLMKNVAEWYVNGEPVENGEAHVTRGEVFSVKLYLNGEDLSNRLDSVAFQQQSMTENTWTNKGEAVYGYNEIFLGGHAYCGVMICIDFDYPDIPLRLSKDNKFYLSWDGFYLLRTLRFEMDNGAKTPVKFTYAYSDDNVSSMDITNYVEQLESEVSFVTVNLVGVVVEYRDKAGAQQLVSFEYTDTSCGITRYFQSGTGTAEDPYIIANTAQFANINKITVYDEYDHTTLVTGCYKLTTNLSLPGGWTMIGAGADGFSGHFDGNGKIIYNVDKTAAFSKGAEYFGLFTVNYGTIENLTVDVDFDISHKNASYQNYLVAVGGVCAYNRGTLDDVTAKGEITGDGRVYLGGIAGFNRGDIISSDSEVVIRGTNCVGGVAALSSGTLDGAFFRGIIYYDSNYTSSYETYNRIGGLVGELDGGTMVTCGFYGDIIVDFTNGSRSFKPRIGGLAGCRDGGEITGCDMETGVLNLTNLDASKGQRDYAGGRVGQTL